MKISKPLLFFIAIAQVAFVEANFLMMIRIHNFSTDCNECGIYFRYCVIQESVNESIHCQQSYCYVNQEPGIRLDFSQELLLGQFNPITFWGYTEEWKGVQISVAALDQQAPEELLCEAHINVTTDSIQVGVETTPVMYIGPTGNSSITLSFVIVCAEDWYGKDCSSWCPGDNCECDLPVPCHDNCVGVICGENRHCVDGLDVYVCTCDSGFTGRQCDINIDECEGVNCSGNGRCIDKVGYFQCECDLGYSGVLCEVTNTSTASNGLVENNLLVLIIGVAGWTLFVALGLIVIIVCVRTKRKDRRSNQNRRYHTPVDASTTSMISQEFYPDQDILDVSDEELHKNISYRAIAPLQAPAAAKVTASHGRNGIKMTRNRAYQTGGYEYVD